MVTVIEHDHPLKLIDLQVNDEDVEEAEADEEEEKDVVIQKDFVCPCKCKRCDQPIHEYYRYYYKSEQRAKYNPKCRVCNHNFYDERIWIYKCEKCIYYVHAYCATSREEPFMHILLTSRGPLVKNFEDADYPHLFHLPFPDQTCSIPKQLLFKEIGPETCASLRHTSHHHELILVNTKCIDGAETNLCHNPMKKMELFCNACVRPIMEMPFYKCATNEDESCNFALHEWCTRLPSRIDNHPDHPHHTLHLMSNVSGVTCEVYIHPECALLLPGTIRHPYDKHPMNLSYLPIENHKSEYFCEVCENVLNPHACFYHCDECSQSLHSACAPAICCETTTYSDRRRNISQHINLKFGSIHKIDGHSHPLLFAQGIKSDGQCSICSKGLRYMILKCLQCKYAIDYECCERLNLMNNS
ncbi:hypothetical protein HanPSC8_Chr01g0035931 [Helianthus annuus]|nr:hypothetical protein HanPSC8_Chr01g0035931 [Helianthus annuus]